MDENFIIYDWFAMTCKSDSVNSVIDFLQFNNDLNWTETYGFYGYKNRIVFDGISIHYNHWNKDQDYPLIEMSGQGCRDFETYTDGNWYRLFERALDTDNYNITRLDVAFDDHSGLLDISNIVKLTHQRNYVSRSQKFEVILSGTANLDAFSVMYGVKSSEFYIRIYDKAAERGGLNEHWVRCESVLKHDRALNFISNNSPIGQKYGGVLKNYLRFVRPDHHDSNKNRWKTQPFWDKFLGNVEAISVTTKKDVDYNLHKIEHYIMHQAGNSVETIIRCIGVQEFMRRLKHRGTELNVHQKRLIDEYFKSINQYSEYR